LKQVFFNVNYNGIHFEDQAELANDV